MYRPENKIQLSDLSVSRVYRGAEWMLLIYCIWFSISIAASQLFLLLFLALVFLGLYLDKVKTRKDVSSSIFSLSSIKKIISDGSTLSFDFYGPLIIWVCVSFGACLLGFEPWRSITQLLKLSIYFLVPIGVVVLVSGRERDGATRVSQIEKYFIMLFFGQSLAAIHTVISVYSGYEIRPKIPGPVTESGQIVLLFPLLIGMLHFRLRGHGFFLKKKLLLSFLLVFIPLVLFSWHRRFDLISSDVAVLLVLIAAAYAVYTAYRLFRNYRSGLFANMGGIVSVLAMVIFAAFVLNLKRGPWLAVVVEVVLFGLLFSRFTMITFLVVVFLCSLLPPVSERIFTFAEHFFIGGGRFDMWKLGFQLIERFPMGIGYANSNLMREFDPTLPVLHRHMHNNVLNIALETGILGALTFVWWFVHFILSGFRSYARRCKQYFLKAHDQPHIIYVILVLISIIGWQTAGLVEYNFGDGEIRLLALVLIGLLLSAATDADGEGRRKDRA